MSKAIGEALGLMNSMIAGGESHSPKSRAMLEKAWEDLKLCEGVQNDRDRWRRACMVMQSALLEMIPPDRRAEAGTDLEDFEAAAMLAREATAAFRGLQAAARLGLNLPEGSPPAGHSGPGA